MRKFSHNEIKSKEKISKYEEISMILSRYEFCNERNGNHATIPSSAHNLGYVYTSAHSHFFLF